MELRIFLRKGNDVGAMTEFEIVLEQILQNWSWT